MLPHTPRNYFTFSSFETMVFVFFLIQVHCSYLTLISLLDLSSPTFAWLKEWVDQLCMASKPQQHTEISVCGSHTWGQLLSAGGWPAAG